jgi:diguanylate cyclase (GGDEF)-like protein
MQTPDIPNNETERVEKLHSMQILDTEPEERFDRLTRVAKRMFGVPMALVSLVDVDRQWFKSRQGVDASQTSRDVSFCAHAINGDDILEVPDALADPRFSDNPLVTGNLGIRFYAGCPLTVPQGLKLGTLCLLDVKPRELNDDDRALFRDLARMAQDELIAVQLATMDHLTQLTNRRGFQALSNQILAGCKRLNVPASLLFFDLDGFKEINDQLGHAEGDRILREFADILRSIFRDSDLVARLGGDEFVVLISNSHARDAEQALLRLSKAVAEHNTAEQRRFQLAYSVGLVEYEPLRHDNVEGLLEDADRAMYQNKQARQAKRRSRH